MLPEWLNSILPVILALISNPYAHLKDVLTRLPILGVPLKATTQVHVLKLPGMLAVVDVATRNHLVVALVHVARFIAVGRRFCHGYLLIAERRRVGAWRCRSFRFHSGSAAAMWIWAPG